MYRLERKELESKYKDIPLEQRAVIYARYSTQNQTPESIERQKELCHDYAEKNGLTVIKEYHDEAKSGTQTLTRDSYNQMLEDSEEKLFSKVIVFKFDRFSRNLRDFLNDEYRLNGNGVKIVSTMEPVAEGAMGKLSKYMIIIAAELYADSVSEHTSSALHRKARQGKYNGGKIPLGYTTAEDGDDKKYVIDEKEAETVRFIFEQYKQGKSYEELAHILDQRGIRNKNGNRFTKGSFNSIFNNRFYLGEIYYNGEFIRKDPDLQIVDDELFEAVQKRRRENKFAAGQKSGRRRYFLSGYVKCGECGANMQINSTKKTDKEGNKYPYSAYVCSNAKKKDENGNKLCDCEGIRRKYLQSFMMEKIVSGLFGSASLQDVTNRLNEFIRSQEKEINKELNEKQKELNKQNIRLDNIKTKIADGNDGMEDELRKTEKLVSGIEKNISDLRKRLKAKELKPNDVVRLIRRLQDNEIKTLDVPEFHDFIKAYVKEIIVRKNNISFRFNFMHPVEVDEDDE